jgi:NAD(P)-dependent dehydrogenase (short-subunit alcohol dehydrogenase family)
MRSRFCGRVAFVTGGARGIGAAVARRLTEEGARVAVADIDLALAEKTAAALPGAVAIELDVRVPESVEWAVADTVRLLGGLHIVVNNAGVPSAHAPVHEFTTENWQRVTAVNTDGAFHVLKYGIAALLDAGGGAVVSTSSICGITGLAGVSPYTFAKAGLMGLTRSVALEYADRGIRVNAVAPSKVATALLDEHIATGADPGGLRDGTDTFNPMPGIVGLSDVAAAVAFLASDDAQFITGVTLPVDGGYTAR